MSAAAHFAPSYRAARRLFLDATSAARLTLQTFAHPLPGADGEALAMDVARAGGFELPSVLVVSSACHGVEGHCGSGIQHAMLCDAALLAEAQAAGVALLFVHALNPHGFSHSRRVTHEGVDLNRNFVAFEGIDGLHLPANPGYDALADFILPKTWPPTPENEAALLAFAAQHGERALQQAITGGQHRHPQGLFYGGTAPTWSHLTIQRVLRQHGSSAQRLAWVDLHTGLGPCGHGERIFAARPDAETLARARAWWGADGGTVTALHDGSSSASQISGMLWQAAYDSCPQAEFTGMALEFGTVPLAQTLQALRFDHWCAANPQAPAAEPNARQHARPHARPCARPSTSIPTTGSSRSQRKAWPRHAWPWPASAPGSTDLRAEQRACTQLSRVRHAHAAGLQRQAGAQFAAQAQRRTTDDPFTTQLGLGHVVAHPWPGCEAGEVEEPPRRPGIGQRQSATAGAHPAGAPEITKRCSAPSPHDNLRQQLLMAGDSGLPGGLLACGGHQVRRPAVDIHRMPFHTLHWLVSLARLHVAALGMLGLLNLLALLGLLGLFMPMAASADTSAPNFELTLMADSRSSVAVWPGVTVLTDVDGKMDLQQAQSAAAAGRFQVPQGTPGNLGRSASTVWLRFFVDVPGAEPVHRVLEIDYAPLNRIDLYVLRGGVLVERMAMGNELRQTERLTATRTHATPLHLEHGRHEMLLRVHTQSSLVLPITLRTPEAFTANESLGQIVLGLVIGLALCMLLYSLTHWFSLRDVLFLDYTLLLAANLVFLLAYSGLGAQYLWPEWPALSMPVAPMAVMVAVAAASRFMAAALAVHEISRFIAWLMRWVSIAALVALAATLLGVVSYRTAQTLVTVLGLAATAAVIPAAYIRARKGERAAAYMLFGWAFYTLGALTVAGLLRGWVEPTFWTQHIYPLSLIVEMSAWMAVLSLRVQAIHRNADRARLETETLRNLAQTDALTGLPNRRGLQQHLAAALPLARPHQLLALYLLDLDGFKPVNDRYGHDVGDALLIAVGKRLQAQLRASDVVARLGGDEFVVLAASLADEQTAHAVGQKMLAAFNQPFIIDGQVCEVGITAGYALAPLDGHTADELLKRADAAMYAGKQAGRRRVQRGERSLVTA